LEKFSAINDAYAGMFRIGSIANSIGLITDWREALLFVRWCTVTHLVKLHYCGLRFTSRFRDQLLPPSTQIQETVMCVSDQGARLFSIRRIGGLHWIISEIDFQGAQGTF
jgi:hypothetical protein